MLFEKAACSFRDPDGFVFWKDGHPYRQIHFSYREHYDHLLRSGLYEELVSSGLLIPHEEVCVEEARGFAPEAYKWIKPEKIPFVSYPYEWCFSQLKDAALLTLQAFKRALRHGMILKDGSAYNAQFHRGRPLFIDTLSFEKRGREGPWYGYGQFCRHFLAPLALMSFKDASLGRLAELFIDGVPLPLASSLLPFGARFRWPLFLHLFLHAWGERHLGKPAQREKALGGKMSVRALEGLAESLEEAIHALRPPSQGRWKSYEKDHPYSERALESKRRIAADYLKGMNGKTLWDLGANTGFYSRLASGLGWEVLSVDADAACVEENYKECKRQGNAQLLPLWVDLANPSAGRGWCNKERFSLLERGPADAVMVLALLHHWRIGNRLPFDRMASFLSHIGRHLIIEFVPRSDPKVCELLWIGQSGFEDYTRENFEREFEKHFMIRETRDIEDSERVLYRMEKR
ncbi:MAG: class I SAM-dependent methyltransferase [Candidatus Omnitrophica bacterium]|nr:class I SAM-dependent methyltransferase [Candidatus Omnitrophota bacterium]